MEELSRYLKRTTSPFASGVRTPPFLDLTDDPVVDLSPMADHDGGLILRDTLLKGKEDHHATPTHAHNSGSDYSEPSQLSSPSRRMAGFADGDTRSLNTSDAAGPDFLAGKYAHESAASLGPLRGASISPAKGYALDNDNYSNLINELSYMSVCTKSSIIFDDGSDAPTRNSVAVGSSTRVPSSAARAVPQRTEATQQSISPSAPVGDQRMQSAEYANAGPATPASLSSISKQTTQRNSLLANSAAPPHAVEQHATGDISGMQPLHAFPSPTVDEQFSLSRRPPARVTLGAASEAERIRKLMHRLKDTYRQGLIDEAVFAVQYAELRAMYLETVEGLIH